MSGVAGSRAAATAVGLTATLGVAAACWVVSVRQMNAMAPMDGMDMGAAALSGSPLAFAALWVPMMAAMMLPGATPAVIKRARASGSPQAVLLFVASYLAIWTLLGVVAFAIYRPLGQATIAAIAVAAGVYELTPLKKEFRRRCRASAGSGFDFGMCCVGSSIGLMLVQVTLGFMSVLWMAVIALVVVVQKLLPARAVIDLPLALALIGLGILILVAPASVPGFMPAM